MDNIKLSELIGKGAKANTSNGFDINKILDTVQTLAKVKAQTQSMGLGQQQQQQEQNIIQSVPQLKPKIEKAVSENTKEFENRIRELENQLKEKQEVKKEPVDDLLKNIRGLSMDVGKIEMAIDFAIEEKGDLTITETVNFMERTVNLVKQMGLSFDLTQFNSIKTALLFIKTLKGDIKLSELKEVLKDLQQFL